MSRRRIPLRSSAGAALAVLLAISFVPARAAADEPSPPDASPVSVAERRAAEAYQAYAKKDFAAAIALYLQAYDAAPSGSILYNIARVYDLKLHDRAHALAFYRRYVADPDAQADLVAVSNQRLRELSNVEVAPVVRDAHPQTASEPVEPRRGGWSALRWTGVAVGAVGLAGIGIGSGYGLAAMSKANVAKGSCDGNACTSQVGIDAAKNARSLATVSTVGFVAGSALLAAGVALFLSSGERSAERPSQVQLEALATPSAASLQVVGRW
jgi:tetratricopeptide (TPR) repeat protein